MRQPNSQPSNLDELGRQLYVFREVNNYPYDERVIVVFPTRQLDGIRHEVESMAGNAFMREHYVEAVFFSDDIDTLVFYPLSEPLAKRLISITS